MADDHHSFHTRQWVAPLPSLPSCPSWWQQLQSRARSGRRQAPKTNQGFGINSSFSKTIRLPILPYTTIVSEILPFCDESTLMAFRGVSKEFRDFEIPREFHSRAMNTIEDLSNEQNRQKQKRQQMLLAGALLDPVRYSFKKKVVDEHQRKVWVFLRENSGETTNDENETGVDYSNLWSLPTVTSKVLKLIRDVEFYNGSVYGYDQETARELLLEKGFIDDSDFEQPHLSLKSLLKKNLYGTRDDQEECPVYGKWRAEVSVRDISLNEALEILCNDGSMDQDTSKTQRRWRIPFRTKKRQSDDQEISVQKTNLLDSDDEKLGLSILLSANQNDSIRLAEYSTVFDKTKMSCSILLVRTRGGEEAEVRVLAGRVEPKSKRSHWSFRSQNSGKSLSLSRHSNSSISLSRHSTSSTI